MGWFSLLFASIVTYIIGMLWYGPWFGKQWMKLCGMDPKKMKKMKPSATTLFATFLTTLVTNIVLAFIIQYTEVVYFSEGMFLGALLWVGFIATTMLGGVLHEKMPIRLFMIHAGFHLVTLAISGGILATW